MHLLPSQIEYQKRLAEGLSTDGSARILAFKNKVAAMVADPGRLRRAPLPPRVPAQEVCHNQSSQIKPDRSVPPAQAPEPPKGYENAMTALYSRNAAPRPVRKTARCLPQVRHQHPPPSCCAGLRLLAAECYIGSCTLFCGLKAVQRPLLALVVSVCCTIRHASHN